MNFAIAVFGALGGVALWLGLVAAPVAVFMAAAGAALMPGAWEWVLLGVLCAGVPVSGVVGAIVACRTSR